MAATDPISNALFEWWGGVESTFGAGGAASPAADDAFVHESADVGPVSAARIIEVMDKTGERTYRYPVQGAYEPVPFTFKTPLRPAFATQTEPDEGFFYKAAGFTVALGVYSRTRVPAVSGWAWGVSHDGKCGRSFAGMAVEKITINAGDGIASVDFAGQAAAKSEVYEATLEVAATSGQTQLTLVAGSGWVVPTGGAPCYVTCDAGVTVHKVTAFDQATSIATITPAVPVAGYADVSTVALHRSATRTYAAQAEPMAPVAEQTHSFDLNNGSEEIYVVDFSLEIDTGVKLRRKEAHSSFVRGLHGNRAAPAQVKANLVFLLGNAKLSGYLEALATKDLRIQIGPTSGRYIRIDANTIKLKKADVPEGGADGAAEGTIEASIYALNAAAGSDLTISYL
jgi:hypothetical protein